MEADVVKGFAELFRGYPNAYGTGRGGWVHRAPTLGAFLSHLEGSGDGLGIGPLLPDDTAWFGAIDLDRPDFDRAKQFMGLLPGTSWLERSRSGNAHVLVFFVEPIEAWVLRGVLREALAAYNERGVEVFPKTDHLLPGMVGNYLNLPYFGGTRPVIAGYIDGAWLPWNISGNYTDADVPGAPLEKFVEPALRNRNDPADWRKRAKWLGVPSPQEREAIGSKEFGTTSTLHICGEHVIANRETNPVTQGHRAVVYFSLSKMLANWSEIDDEEALSLLALVNDASPDPISMGEIERIYANVKRGQFTSTGCDDPLFTPYRHPDCKIGA